MNAQSGAGSASPVGGSGPCSPARGQGLPSLKSGTIGHGAVVARSSAGRLIMTAIRLEKGMRIRIRHEADSPSRETWRIAARGEVVDVYTEWRSPLGNAFAGSPSGEYPLLRVTVREDDGSLTDAVLDERTEIDVLS